MRKRIIVANMEMWHATKDIYLENIVIWQDIDTGEYYIARVPDRNPEIEALEGTRIPTESLYLPANAIYASTTAVAAKQANWFIKGVHFSDYGNPCAPQPLGRILIDELEICEILRRYPHPNICAFKGYISERGLCVGLCLERQWCSILDAVWRKHIARFDKCQIVADITLALRHLHSLDIIHVCHLYSCTVKMTRNF